MTPPRCVPSRTTSYSLMVHLLFGYGYLGQRVARLWCDAGDQVTVVTRSTERSTSPTSKGVHTIIADACHLDTFQSLPSADTMLFAIPADTAAKAFASLDKLPEFKRLITISTTGVYGDADGAWVDETTSPAPTRPAAQCALTAERYIVESPCASRSIILRLGGIYGPGRVPFLQELHNGDPIPATEHGWLNLIHVDDAARIVTAAEELPYNSQTTGPLVLNITDGHPVVRGDYYREIAQLLTVPPPRFIPPNPASPRALRAAVSRRVSNRRMQRELGVELRYRSYREGLRAIVERG